MKENSPIRVMLVDDHAIVRDGLALFFQLTPDFELVSEVGNGEEAVNVVMRVKPDVILMDLFMPGMDGLTAIRKIHDLEPQIPILVLTSTAEGEVIQNALRAGAVGYLIKSIDTEELAEAIHTVCRGESYLIPEASQLLMRRIAKPEHARLGADLTARELEVLKLIVDGCSNQEIAEQLEVSLPTAKFHVGNILTKLHVRSRTAAVVTALEHNLHVMVEPGHSL